MDLEKITSQVNEAITQLELKKGIYFTFVGKMSQRNKLKPAGLYDLYFEIYSQMLNILHHVQSSGCWYCFLINLMAVLLVDLVQQQFLAQFVKLHMILEGIFLRKINMILRNYYLLHLILSKN